MKCLASFLHYVWVLCNFSIYDGIEESFAICLWIHVQQQNFANLQISCDFVGNPQEDAGESHAGVYQDFG